MSTQAPSVSNFSRDRHSDAAFLIAAEPEIGAAMRTILVDDADHAA